MKDVENLEYLISMEKEGLSYSKLKTEYNFDLNNLKLIKSGILNNKKLKGIYHQKQRKIEPLGIIFKEKAYLIGYEKEKGEDVYCYNISKLSCLEMSEENFDKNDFNLKDYAQKSFGIYGGEVYKIELLFSKEIKDKVKETIIHPSQKFVENNNGEVSVFLEASGSLEIFRYIFKWGKDCKIIAPSKLVSEYKNYLKEIIDIY